jgi:hypothetical protein
VLVIFKDASSNDDCGGNGLSYFKLTILKSNRKNNKNTRIRIALGAEKNIWTEEGRSDRRLEETA